MSGNIPKTSRARGIRLHGGVGKRLCLAGCVSTLRESGAKVQRGSLKCSGGFLLVKIAQKRRYYVEVEQKGREHINLSDTPGRG